MRLFGKFFCPIMSDSRNKLERVSVNCVGIEAQNAECLKAENALIVDLLKPLNKSVPIAEKGFVGLQT